MTLANLKTIERDEEHSWRAKLPNQNETESMPKREKGYQFHCIELNNVGGVCLDTEFVTKVRGSDSLDTL